MVQSRGTQSFLKAATTVLPSASRPLTVREITDEALRRGLVETGGKTPESSMSAALYTAAKSPTPAS